MVFLIEPDSSVCVWEFENSTDLLCAYFRVRYNGPAQLTVEARPLDGGASPLLGWDSRGVSAQFSYRWDSAGTVIQELTAAIPHTAAPQRYEVVTSVQSP